MGKKELEIFSHYSDKEVGAAGSCLEHCGKDAPLPPRGADHLPGRCDWRGLEEETKENEEHTKRKRCKDEHEATQKHCHHHWATHATEDTWGHG